MSYHDQQRVRVRVSVAGVYLLEVVASMMILSTMALGVTYGSVMSLKTHKASQRNSISAQIALDRLEDFSIIDPSTLDDSDDEAATILYVENIQFSYSVNVTVNADGSRTVEVTVVAPNAEFGGDATFSSTFYQWGTV